VGTARNIFGYAWVILNTIPVALLCALFGAIRWYWPIDPLIRYWSGSLLFVFGVRCKAHGTEHAPQAGSCVILSTHRSNLDAPCLITHMPLAFSFVIKRVLMRIPIFGWGVHGARYVSIERTNRVDALSGLARACDLLRKGRSILLFPEGTRSPDDHMLPLKKGGIVLAIQAQVPILPVAVGGTRALMPKGRWHIDRGRTALRIGQPIPTAGLTYEDRDRLNARVSEVLTGLYDEVRQDLQK